MNNSKNSKNNKTNKSSKVPKNSDQTFELKFDIPGSTKTLIEKMIKDQNLKLIRRIANKNGWNYKDLINIIKEKGGQEIIL